MSPLYEFRCESGHLSERRVSLGVRSVECDCGLAAEHVPVARIAYRMAGAKGIPIANYAEAAAEAEHRHDSTDDPAARAATHPEIWKAAAQRAKTRAYERALGYSGDTHWVDPRPKVTEREVKSDIG